MMLWQLIRQEQVRQQVTAIGETLESIFCRAQSSQIPTSVIADQIAEEIFLAPKLQSRMA